VAGRIAGRLEWPDSWIEKEEEVERTPGSISRWATGTLLDSSCYRISPHVQSLLSILTPLDTCLETVLSGSVLTSRLIFLPVPLFVSHLVFFGLGRATVDFETAVLVFHRNLQRSGCQVAVWCRLPIACMVYRVRLVFDVNRRMLYRVFIGDITTLESAV
jgi:hypothetical protein